MTSTAWHALLNTILQMRIMFGVFIASIFYIAFGKLIGVNDIPTDWAWVSVVAWILLAFCLGAFFIGALQFIKSSFFTYEKNKLRRMRKKIRKLNEYESGILLTLLRPERPHRKIDSIESLERLDSLGLITLFKDKEYQKEYSYWASDDAREYFDMDKEYVRKVLKSKVKS